MNIISIIEKKRDGFTLTNKEIKYFIDAYCNEEIADYQASALLMAICIQGMNKEETHALTKAMLESGVCLDLKEIDGIKVDKHSTGGVGDKTSLVLGPMCAACGLEFAKMSGRGLGHTGGTLDKLESMQNFTISLSIKDFIDQVNDCHIAIIGQNKDFTPADKKLYALRDVTGTVPSIPLIASSIMSKKLASGADVILLDVKYGDGAFMKDAQSAIELAKTMIEIGEGFNKKVKAEISNMNEPLGYAIGNSLEVKEAIATLHNKGPKDLRDLCIHSGATLLAMSDVCSVDEGKKRMEEVLENGLAYTCFLKMVQGQHGIIENNEVVFVHSPIYEMKVYSVQSGYVKAIKTKQLGLISCALGAGRMKKEDLIDMNSGIIITKKIGDYVSENELLATLYAHKLIDTHFIKDVLDCYCLSEEKVAKESLIYTTL